MGIWEQVQNMLGSSGNDELVQQYEEELTHNSDGGLGEAITSQPILKQNPNFLGIASVFYDKDVSSDIVSSAVDFPGNPNSVEKIGIENLPNVYFNKVEVNKFVDDNTVQIRLNNIVLSMYDYQRRDESVWRHQEMLRKYLKVRLSFVAVVSNDRKVAATKVLSGESLVTEYEEAYGSDLVKKIEYPVRFFTNPLEPTDGAVSDLPPAVSGELRSFFWENSIWSGNNGITISRETWDNYKPNVYLFAQTFIDIQRIISDFGADFGFTQYQNYMGPLKAEALYLEAEPLSEGTVFFRSDSTVSLFDPASALVFGAVHLAENSEEHFQGSFHREEDNVPVIPSQMALTKIVYLEEE